eukprot:129271_1
MSAEKLIQTVTDNYDGLKKYESKLLTFKYHFMPKEANDLQTTMVELDKVKINMVTLVSSYHYYPFEIISCVLLILFQISSILCLLSLYKHNEMIIITYTLLSFTIIGILINIGFSTFTAVNIIIYLNTQSKILQFIIYISTVIFSIIFSPIFWVWILRKNYPNEIEPRFNNLILISCAVALPQSIITMVIVVMHYNIYAVLLLTFSICCVLISTCSVYSSVKHISQTIIIGLIYIIIDYVSMLCIVIFICSDTTTLIGKYYLYNAMLGCPLFALIISYGAAKQWTDTFDVVCNSLLMQILVILVCILFGIMFTICSEVCCICSVYLTYSFIRSKKQSSGMDWNLLKWIMNNVVITDTEYNIFNYFNFKDKIQRLCVVNGLIIDCLQLQTTENQKQVLLKQYLIENCRNNFEDVCLKELSEYFDGMSWWKWIILLFSADENTDKKYRTMVITFAFVLYMISRLNRFIILPIFVAIYFNNLNQHTTVTYFAISMQFLCIIIGLIISLFIFMEMRYSMYLIPSGVLFSETVREMIGFYYKATTIHELSFILRNYFDSDITNIIVSFVSVK